MDDLVKMKICHSVADLLRPVEEQTLRQTAVISKYLVQLAVRTVLHYNAIARSLRTDSPNKYKTR